jgi:hypothetical protein
MTVIPHNIPDFQFITDAIFLVSVHIDESIKDYIFGMTSIIHAIKKLKQFAQFNIRLCQSKDMLH